MVEAAPDRVEVGDLTIAYRSSGTGPPLVLLHGFLCDARVWRRELDQLSDRFTVVAWDAPGAGRSSDPAAPFTISDWADVLAAFLDRLGIDRARTAVTSPVRRAWSRRTHVSPSLDGKIVRALGPLRVTSSSARRVLTSRRWPVYG